jgi:hypothetical protein
LHTGPELFGRVDVLAELPLADSGSNVSVQSGVAARQANQAVESSQKVKR